MIEVLLGGFFTRITAVKCFALVFIIPPAKKGILEGNLYKKLKKLIFTIFSVEEKFYEKPLIGNKLRFPIFVSFSVFKCII